MENRFGLKDLLLIGLIVVLIVVQFLQMKQRDLQQKEVRAIATSIETQSAQIAALMRALNTMSFAPPSGPTTQSATTSTAGFGDPFAGIKEAEKMPGYARGDWYVDNLGTKVGRLTPMGSAADLYGAIVRAKIIESCAYRDPMTLDFVPLVAQSWNISPDGLTIRVQLRRGVTFSDGHPLTADDIVWTFNWLMKKEVDAPRERAYYDKVAKVEKNGDYEVVWTFKEPYFQALELAVGMDILPKHFYEKFTPEQFNQQPGLLLGSGPYRLKDPTSWTPGQRLELVRNDYYWGVPGPWDRIVWYEVESDAVEMTMFRNGEVDRFSAQPEQYKLLMKDPAVLQKNNHFEIDSPLSGYAYIAWNEKRGNKPTWWNDKRVRQAMTMLTDRKAICDQVFLGYASVTSGPFAPQTKAYNANVKPLPYDPARGKSLLMEAGFKVDANGLLVAPDGKPFRFKLTYPSKNETYERVALLLKDGFAKAGIAMEPDPADWPIMLKKINDRDYDAITLGWSGSIESDIYQEFHSSQIKDQGDNFISYTNPELDKLMEQARATVDEAKRTPMWHRCHEILAEDQPYTFLYTRKGLVFYDKRIQNIKESKLGLNYIHDYQMPIPWFVPKAAQKWK
jgi:peptide/nickel transport system substrate-binding protein